MFLHEGINDLEFVVAVFFFAKQRSFSSLATLKSHDLLREAGDIVVTSSMAGTLITGLIYFRVFAGVV